MTTIRVRVTDSDVLYSYSQPQTWYANAFQVGDMEVDTLNKPLAKIVNIEKFSIDSTHQAVYLDLEVRALYDTRSKQYSFKGKPLIFGSPLKFNLKHVYFDSIVVRTPDEQQNNSRVKVGVKAKLYNTPKYYADAVKKFEGKSVLDNKGEAYVTINKITDVELKNIYRLINPDNFTLQKSDEYSDLTLDIIVYAKKTPHEYYAYEDIPVKISESIPINFPELTFHPTITDMNLE